MLSGFGNEVSAALCAGPHQNGATAASVAAALNSLKDRFAAVMMFSGPELHNVVQKSADDTKAFAGTLGVNVANSSFFKVVNTWIDAGPDSNAKLAAEPAPTLAQADGTDARTEAIRAVKEARENEYSALTAGISKLSNAIVGDFKLTDIYRMTLDVMWQAMDFQRVLMLVRDEKSGYMVGQLGCGKDAAMIVRKFRFPLKDTPNVFQLATNNSLDIVIKDIADPKITDKIPPWYRSMVSARTFILMPLVIKGKSVAMIYGDKQEPNSIAIAERELALLKTLRNQAVLAIKHSESD